MTPLEMQHAVLVVLFDRATKGHWSDASLTKPRINELLATSTGNRISNAVLQIYLDDLIATELVSAPQRGVRDRFQITSKGIHKIDAEPASDFGITTINSEAWTGRLDRLEVTEAHRERILSRIRELSTVVHKTNLTNAQKSQAEALIAAAVTMVEAPEPPWEIVKQVLMLIASVSTVLTLALEIAKTIK